MEIILRFSNQLSQRQSQLSQWQNQLSQSTEEQIEQLIARLPQGYLADDKNLQQVKCQTANAQSASP